MKEHLCFNIYLIWTFNMCIGHSFQNVEHKLVRLRILRSLKVFLQDSLGWIASEGHTEGSWQLSLHILLFNSEMRFEEGEVCSPGCEGVAYAVCYCTLCNTLSLVLSLLQRELMCGVHDGS